MRLVAAIGSALLFSTMLSAQAQTPTADATGFEKKTYNYSEWTKGLFSEVITVTHPGKMIFLAGWEPKTKAARAEPSVISATLRASAVMPMRKSNGCWQPKELQ